MKCQNYVHVPCGRVKCVYSPFRKTLGTGNTLFCIKVSSSSLFKTSKNHASLQPFWLNRPTSAVEDSCKKLESLTRIITSEPARKTRDDMLASLADRRNIDSGNCEPSLIVSARADKTKIITSPRDSAVRLRSVWMDGTRRVQTNT